MDLLLLLGGAEGGGQKLQALLDRAGDQLRSGDPTDWDTLLGDGSDWQAAGVAPAEAQDAFQDLVGFLSPRSELDLTVIVRQQVGGEIDATFRGDAVRLSVRRPAGASQWGSYTGYEVVSGPAALLGARLVDVDIGLDDEKKDDAAGTFQAEVGETLYLARPDRAAVKDIIVFDLLPDITRGLVALLDAVDEVEEGSADATVMFDGGPISAEDVSFEPAVRDAIRFSSRLQLLPGGEDSRLAERLRRLGEFPVVRELRAGVEADPRWGELLRAGRAEVPALYNATRTAMLRELPEYTDAAEDNVQVFKLGMDPVVPVIGFGLALLLCLGWVASLPDTAYTSGAPGGGEALPLYSLSSDSPPPTS